jgi:hypothetical protein
MNLTLCSENKEMTDKRVLKFPCEYYGCTCDEEGANTNSSAISNSKTIISIIIIIKFLAK